MMYSVVPAWFLCLLEPTDWLYWLTCLPAFSPAKHFPAKHAYIHILNEHDEKKNTQDTIG